MAVQTFNEKSMKDGPVPTTGSTTGASPSGPGGVAKGVPRAVDQADGTANLRADSTVKTAGPRSVPSGKNRIPAAVDSFSDAAV